MKRSRPLPDKHPLESEIGRYIRYYENGWRFARLVSIEQCGALYKAFIERPGKHRKSWVDVKDVEAIKDCGAR